MLCRIGDVEIWRVLESVEPFMPATRFFPDMSAEEVDRRRAQFGPEGLRRDEETGMDWLVLPVQAFLLRTPRNLILVDACIGNDKTLPMLATWDRQRSGRFMAALAAADADVAEVTHVMCTHLHVDHIGWTTTLRDGRWVPTFPNARVLATQADLDYARAQAEETPDGLSASVWRESIEPLLEDGRFDIVAPDHQVENAVRLRPTPGHTPGHVSVEVRAPGLPGAEVTGDLIHSPVQCALPGLNMVADADPAEAARTRLAFLERSADTRRLLFATHFPLPSMGRVERWDDAFRWVTDLG